MSFPVKFHTLSISFLLTVIISLSVNYAPLNAQTLDKNSLAFLDAVKNYNLGNKELAEKQLRELASADPGNDAIHFYLANIHLSRSEMSKAEEEMIKALRIDPSNSWYKQHLASIYTFRGKINKAIEVYNELRKEKPLESELYDGLIELYIQQKEYAKAREVLEDIEKSIGINEATGLTRYNLMIYEGRQEEAAKYLEEFDKEHGSPRTSAIIGDNYAAATKDSIAERYYVRSLSMAPDYMPANFGLAEIYRVKGKYDLYFERINPFLKSADVDPAMKVGYMRQILTNTRFVQTFLPQVDTMMNNLYGAHPEDSSIAFTYSLFLVQSDQSGKALEVLHTNLQKFYSSKEAHRQYLSLIYYLEMWEPMEKKSDEALTVFRNDPDFLQFKGIAQVQSGKTESSVLTFKEILKHTKDSATVVNTLTNIADMLYRVGNKKEAYKYYQKVIKQEPKHVPALNNYAYFLSLDGKNLKQAYKMSKVTVEIEPNNPTYLDTFAWILHLMGNNIEAKSVFKHAMIYGGKENADILDHYAEVLFALKEYDLAFIYWNQAHKLDPSLGIETKIETRKKEMKQ
ncbi:MAG: tetratricopeptide repeat protein [Bacteroidales bacterium]